MVLINQFINFKIGGVTVSTTSTELNYNAGVTPGTAKASSTLVLDASKDVSGINHLSASQLTGTLLTAAQPNITSLGKMTSLHSNGILSVGDNTGANNGILRILTTGGFIYVQPGYNTVTGSGTHLYITNYNESVSTSSRIVSSMSTGKFGIQTYNPIKQLEINSTTGDCLRLTYNNNSGTAVNYTDLAVNSGGDLTITPSGGITSIGPSVLNVYSSSAVAISNSTNMDEYSFIAKNDTNFTNGKVGVAFCLSSSTIDLIPPGASILHERTGSNSIGDLIFSTKSVTNCEERMRILSTGNVGIGTNNPADPLHVKNAGYHQLRLESSSTTAAANIKFVTTAKTYEMGCRGPSSGNANSFYWHDGTYRMIIADGGKVGINTIAPNKQLEINSATGDCLRLTYNDTNGSAAFNCDLAINSGGGFIITPSGGITQNIGILNVAKSHSSAFYVSSGATRYFVVNTVSGLVGINTSTPDKALEINSATGDCLRLTYNDADGSATNKCDFIVDSSGNLRITNSATYLRIGELNSMTPSEGQFIATAWDGSVRKLVLGLDDNSTMQSYMLFQEKNNTNNTAYMAFFTTNVLSTPATEKMRIDWDGNVGIGTTTPNALLNVENSTANADNEMIRLTNLTDSNSTGASIKWYKTAGGNIETGRIDNYRFASGDYGLRFYAYDSGLPENLTLRHSNVGINTSDPDQRLTVNDGNIKIAERNAYADDRYIYCQWEEVGNCHSIGMEFDYYTGSGGNGTTHSRLNFVSNATDATEIYGTGKQTMMTILSNGLVGIGTNSPNTPLHITDTGGTLLTLTSTFSTSHSHILFETNGSDWEFGARGTNATNAPNSMYWYNSGYKMVLSNGGKLGLGGIVTPLSDLHIKQSSDNYNGGLRLESADGNWWNFFTHSNNNFEFQYQGATKAYLFSTSNVGSIDFTGQHRSSTDNTLINNDVSKYIGLIVSSTGVYNNINGGELNINEALPKVDLSNTDKDKKVYGVISDREDDNEDRVYTQGAFASVVDKDEGDERLIVNSLGEGMIWVCDKDGTIENGDLITSCTAAGYGTKQDNEFLCNYTVGKITQDCDFSTPERYITLAGIEVSQTIYNADIPNHRKCNFVGCVYYCG